MAGKINARVCCALEIALDGCVVADTVVIDRQTAMAPMAAFTMAGLLFVYVESVSVSVSVSLPQTWRSPPAVADMHGRRSAEQELTG